MEEAVMAYGDIRQYIASLARTGELLEIDAEVDPIEELGAICRKVLDEDGPAILFNNVQGYDYPVIANMLATPGRIAQALEVPVEELTEEYTKRTSGADLQRQPLVDSGPVKRSLLPVMSSTCASWCHRFSLIRKMAVLT
ncbi:MAG: hypothetical protein DRQ52_05660 [Gammaproteobacteria bacterium]|nr:MAG: hypothetical protein DRQ52_05660 [Gammaproteobacteria bacterium]